MKKMLSLVLTLVLALSVIGGIAVAEDAKVFEALTEITYFCADENGDIPVTDDLWMFQQIAQQTNIKLKTIVAPIANYDEKLGTVLASGSLPDLLAIRKADVNCKLYGPQGAFVDLMPYVEAGKMPNFKALMDKFPNSWAMALAADGGLYYAPRIYDYEWTTEGFQMRRDILAELNLEVPKTTDDFYAALKAMKEAYPDSTPFTNKWGADHVLVAFSRAFDTYYDIYLHEDTQTWAYGPMEPAYKDMLAYCAKLYAEGLLDKEFATLPDAQMTEKIVNSISFSTYNYLGEGNASTIEGVKLNPDFLYYAIPMLTDPNGNTKGAEVLNSVYVQFGKAISSKSKYIDQLVAYLDWTYSPEAVMLLQFGIEGEQYKIEDGALAYVEPYEQLKERQAKLLGNQNVLSVSHAYNFDAQPEITKMAREQVLSGAIDKAIPVVTLADTETVTQKFAPIKTYVQENAVKVITGAMKVDEWDNVVAQLEKMGVNDVVAAYQEAYDAAFAK